MGRGKNPRLPHFNISFTPDSQTRGNQNPGIPPRHSGVFHKFPTPYYGYYNKFNIQKAVLQPFHTEDFLNTRIQNKERR